MNCYSVLERFQNLYKFVCEVKSGYVIFECKKIVV